MLLEGKKLLITGVLTRESIATAVAHEAQRQGAEVVLTSFGRGLRLTRRQAARMDPPVDVLELDVSVPEHFDAIADQARDRWGHVDGVLHAIGFAPESCLGDGVLDAPWEDVAVALQISAFSLKALVAALAPLMPPGSSVVGLDFDASQTFPMYDWMGVAKATLEATARYLARDLGPAGIRVNLVSAGPLRTLAAKSIPGFAHFEATWDERAPLGWDVDDVDATARACVALLSDWFPATTGEIIHVDGGFHAVAVATPPAPSTDDTTR